MDNFHFLCKQGQSADVCEVLRSLGVRPKLSLYSGERGDGVMVSAVLPRHLSKRKVDKELYAYGVAGAVSRRNPPLVILNPGYLSYDERKKLRENPGCKIFFHGKFYSRAEYRERPCECCGSHYYLNARRGGKNIELASNR